jgi:drug/metabolite transporter (DMT)-like permease
MRGLTLTALFGIVSYFFSNYLLLPEELHVFSIFAAAGSMAGFALGDLTAKRIKDMRYLSLVLGMALLICFASFLFYQIHIHRGSANVADLVWLGASITFGFFSFFYLMPLAGVVVDKNWAARRSRR